MPKKKCGIVDCERDAAVYPVFVVWAKGFGKKREPARGVIALPTCAHHAIDVKPEDVITDASWQMIRDGFFKHGKVEPDRETVELEFTPIDAADAEFAAVVGKGH